MAGADRVPSAILERGASLGRYLILEPVGQGAMGVVYAAYDPRLDRRVAVKLLWPSAVGNREFDGRTRLMREAQAMARLHHPNVVTVYDVGIVRVGSEGEQLFLAMELVDGTTLAHWLKQARRSWRDIVSRFVEAGRGLAAAHDAGLVHRDVKPSNMLVSSDGRVLVTDFGVVRRLDDEDATSSGTVVGTPMYMSPEQHAGGVVDERTDQFAFCVSLYEALWGQHPYPRMPDEPPDSPAAPPADSAVPTWVRRIVMRGLHPSPAARHPSMHALLAELSRDPHGARRRWMMATGGALALVAVVAVEVRAHRAAAAVCQGAETRLAGIWDGARKQAIGAAFAATGKPYAADAWHGVARALDDYTHAWVHMRTDACEATRLRHEQSEELLDLRMECLDRRLGDVRAEVELFSRGDAAVVEKAVAAAQSLPGLDGCANVRALKAPAAPPPDAETRARLEAARKGLAAARALEQAGQYSDGLTRARAAALEADALAYRPLQAEAQLRLGALHGRTGDAKAAERALDAATVHAEASGHDEVAAQAWTELVHELGAEQERFAEARAAADHALAWLDRLGERGALRARLLIHRGELQRTAAHYDDALADLQAAEALVRVSSPEDSVMLAQIVHQTAILYRQTDQHALADVQFRRAIELKQKALGPEHPDLGASLNSYANSLSDQGKLDEAMAVFHRALAILEKALGPQHPNVARTLGNMGVAEFNAFRYDDALAHLRRALTVLEPHGDPGAVAGFLSAMGEVLMAQGRYGEAEAPIRRSLELRERTLGATHPFVAQSLGDMSELMRHAGKLREALAYAERALSIRQAAFGPDHLSLSDPLTDMASVYVDLRTPARAIPLLERALLLRKQRSGSPQEAATQFLLARALWAGRGDRARAVALATQARQTFAHAGGQADRREIDDWLAAHRPSP